MNLTKNYIILNESLKTFNVDQIYFKEVDNNIVLYLNTYNNILSDISLHTWENDKELVTENNESIFMYCFLFQRRYNIYNDLLRPESRSWINFIKNCLNIEEVQLKMVLFNCEDK